MIYISFFEGFSLEKTEEEISETEYPYSSICNSESSTSLENEELMADNKIMSPVVFGSASSSSFEVTFPFDNEYSKINVRNTKHILHENEVVSVNLSSKQPTSSLEVKNISSTDDDHLTRKK